MYIYIYTYVLIPVTWPPISIHNPLRVQENFFAKLPPNKLTLMEVVSIWVIWVAEVESFVSGDLAFHAVLP